MSSGHVVLIQVAFTVCACILVYVIFRGLYLMIAFARHPCPSIKSIVFSAATGSVFLLFLGIYDLYAFMVHTASILAGICFLHTFAFFIRRKNGDGVLRSYWLGASLALGLYLVNDLRYIVILSDESGRRINGTGVRVEHPPATNLNTWDKAPLIHVGNGIYYLGFARWARQKSHWNFGDPIHETSGEGVFFTGFSRVPPWYQWPVRMTLPQLGGHKR